MHWHYTKKETRLAYPGERLISSDPINAVVTAGAGIDERLIAQRHYELESRCHGRGSHPCACDY